MHLNIKNDDTYQLAAELASLTGETLTATVTIALRERLERVKRRQASRGYQVVAASDGHTTREKPHLDAAAIITHHNWVWEHLIMPDREVKVLSSSQLLNALSVTT